MKSPSPTRVDELAIEFLSIKQRHLQAMLEVRSIAKELDEKSDALRDLVKEFGSAHAEKAKLLHGITHEIMASFGQSVVIDAVAVDKFYSAARSELSPKKLALLFETTVRYTLASSAAEFIRTNKLSRKVKALYAACQVVKDRTPTLTVRLKEKDA